MHLNKCGEKLVHWLSFVVLSWVYSGSCRRVTRGSFRGISEVSRNHSGFVRRRWVRPFSATKFHEMYTACWIVVLLAFALTRSWENLVKTFFWSPRRKIGDLHKKLCCSVTRNSAWRSHRMRTAKVRDYRLFGNYSAKSLEPPLRVTMACSSQQNNFKAKKPVIQNLASITNTPCLMHSDYVYFITMSVCTVYLIMKLVIYFLFIYSVKHNVYSMYSNRQILPVCTKRIPRRNLSTNYMAI